MRRARLSAAVLALAALLVVFGAATAHAGTYVLDEADVIDTATEQRIEDLSARVEAATPGAEIAVITVKSLDGRSIEEYAEDRFDDLGIGSAKMDNGVMLLVAPTERKVRIEVGYGLEGAIPDARAGRIIDDVIIPAFKAGDMAGGIERGHAEIAALVTAEYGAQVTGVGQPETSSANDWMIWVWIVLGIVALTVVMNWMARKGWLKNTGGGSGGGWRGPGTGGFGGGSTWGSGGGSSGGGGLGGGGFGGGDSGGGGASGGW